MILDYADKQQGLRHWTLTAANSYSRQRLQHPLMFIRAPACLLSHIVLLFLNVCSFIGRAKCIMLKLTLAAFTASHYFNVNARTWSPH